MTKLPLLILITLVSYSANAQFGPQQIISTEARLPIRAITGDINGDGALDIISGSRSIVGNNVAWYENLNGLGNFGNLELVADLDEIRGLDIGDVDGDNDIDILVSSPFQDILVWYENLDGLGSFSNQNTIASSIGNAYYCLLKDLDGDNILDVIVSSDTNNTIRWYKNDGNGNFASPVLVGNQGNGGRRFDVADLDNDGDLDVVATSSTTEAISWYENLDGLGTFGPHQVIEPDIFAKISVSAVDIDDNGFLDIIVTSAGEDSVSWYANNGDGTFGTEQIITDNADFAVDATGGDLDNDGDTDMVYTSALDNTVAWHENLDGLGTFGPQQTLTTDAVSGRDVHIADIDADGDMDVVSASQNDDKVAWYENLTILSVAEFESGFIQLYPNPASETVTITLKDIVTTNYSVTLTNSLGQRLATYDQNAFLDNSVTLSIAGLVNGIYFVTIVAGTTNRTTKLIVE